MGFLQWDDVSGRQDFDDDAKRLCGIKLPGTRFKVPGTRPFKNRILLDVFVMKQLTPQVNTP